jgi:hypothetical protein
VDLFLLFVDLCAGSDHFISVEVVLFHGSVAAVHLNLFIACSEFHFFLLALVGQFGARLVFDCFNFMHRL